MIRFLITSCVLLILHFLSLRFLTVCYAILILPYILLCFITPRFLTICYLLLILNYIFLRYITLFWYYIALRYVFFSTLWECYLYVIFCYINFFIFSNAFPHFIALYNIFIRNLKYVTLFCWRMYGFIVLCALFVLYYVISFWCFT